MARTMIVDRQRPIFINVVDNGFLAHRDKTTKGMVRRVAR